MSKALLSVILMLALLLCGCASGPKPAPKPKITGIRYYSDLPPNTDRNVFFLSEITSAKGKYYEASVLTESHTKGTIINETKILLNGTVPNDAYAFRCDLGNYTTMPDDLIIVHSTVEVWTGKGGRSVARDSEDTSYSSPKKTTDGVYLMIQSGKGANIGSLWFTMYYIEITLRYDGYVTAEAANISLRFNDNSPVKWDNESIPPGEARTGSTTLDHYQFTVTALYDGVPQDSGEYFFFG